MVQPLEFSDKFIQNNLDKGLDIYKLVEKSTFKDIISYALHSNSWKREILSDWIKEQVTNPLPEVIECAKQISANSNYDELIIEILQYIHSRLVYIGDQQHWRMNEYWARAFETINSGAGDCEDGAILTYIIARLKGIPANRLTLFCGDVDGGGHCWLGYKPKNYPLNFCFIDWCYYYDNNLVLNRQIYTIIDKVIYDDDKHYQNIWFWFNEDTSGSLIRYEFNTLD